MEVLITGAERERARGYDLSRFGAFSDIQDARPLPLHELERQ